MDVIPVHPVSSGISLVPPPPTLTLDFGQRERKLDGLRAVPSIHNLPSPSTTALSIATMPLVRFSGQLAD